MKTSKILKNDHWHFRTGEIKGKYLKNIEQINIVSYKSQL